MTGQLAIQRTGTFSKQITFGGKDAQKRDSSQIVNSAFQTENDAQKKHEREKKAEQVKQLIRARILKGKGDVKDFTVKLTPQQKKKDSNFNMLSPDSKFDFSKVPKFAPIAKKEVKTAIRETNEESTVNSMLSVSSDSKDKPKIEIVNSSR